MTKTPEEIIDEAWANDEIVCGWDVRTILDQAGWAIVPKEPTEEMITTASQLYGTVRAMLRAVLAAKS
ncbi:MAG: hypothetical protein ACR2RE_31320 [Geminicoccaceae bacterium]